MKCHVGSPYFVVAGGTLFLAACSGTLSDIVSPILPSRPEVAHVAETEPPYRQIIATHFSEIFASTADVRNVRISSPRRVDYASDVAWSVCLKAETKNVANRSAGVGTYVVVIQKGQLADRRIASPSDKCDQDNYEALSLK